MGYVGTLAYGGMVCDIESQTGIAGVDCQIVGDMGHTASDTSEGESGGFYIVGQFFYHTNPGSAGESADPYEDLTLYLTKAGYEGGEWGFEIGTPNNPTFPADHTFWLTPGGGGQKPQTIEVEAEIDPETFEGPTLTTSPADAAAPSAWLGDWVLSQGVSPISVAIKFDDDAPERHVPTYTIDVVDEIFDETLHTDNTMVTTKQMPPYTGGRNSLTALYLLPTRNLLKAGSTADELAPKVGRAPTSPVRRRVFGLDFPMLPHLHVGAMTQVIQVSGSVWLELYGLYAPGKVLYAYQIRYQRHAGTEGVTGAPLLDLMLERLIVIK